MIAKLLKAILNKYDLVILRTFRVRTTFRPVALQ